MNDRLCPVCGHFDVELVPGVNGEKDHYVCKFCGAKFDADEPSVALNRDSVQRFPCGEDSEARSNLSDFLEKKKKQ